MQDRRVVLERLDEVRLDRVAQQGGHRAVRLQVARGDRPPVARVRDDDPREACLEIVKAVGEAQDRHHLRRDDDVEAVLARIAVRGPAEPDRHVAQRAIVQVDDALPRDAPHVDAERVAVMDVVVDQRRQQVVRERDRVEVAGEVEVDVLHRHDLRMAAAGRAALHAEHRTERRLAQAGDRVRADAVEPVDEPDGRRGLAFAGRRRADAGHEDELAVRPIETGEPVERDLRLEAAVWLERVFRDAEAFPRQRDDRSQRGAPCDLDVALHVRCGCLRGARSLADRGPQTADHGDVTGLASTGGWRAANTQPATISAAPSSVAVVSRSSNTTKPSSAAHTNDVYSDVDR